MSSLPSDVRLLADECVARPIILALRAWFRDVVAIAEIARGSTDAEVLARAASESRVLVTEDYDFGELAYRLRQPAFAIVIIAPGVFHIDDASAARRIANRLGELASELEGRLTIIEEKRIRQRPLAFP